MRLFHIMLSLILIAALVAPFYLEGPNGQPLMTLSDVVEDTPLEKPPAKVYRWTDEFGVAQFGEDPPDGANAKLMAIDEGNLTRMGSEWNVEGLVSSDDEPEDGEFDMHSPMDVYRNAPKIIDSAKDAAQKMTDHNSKIEDLMNNHLKQ